MRNLINLAAIGAFALIMFVSPSCSHGPAIQDFPETASAKDEVVKFRTAIDEAIVNQVDVLSPRYFEESRESLKDATRSLDKQDDTKETLHLVAKGRASLGEAEKFAYLSRANIGDVIVARKEAMDAGAQTQQPEAFKEADEDLTDVTSNIEKNQLDDAIKQRSALQLTYLDLELKAIKQTRLGGARETLKQAEKDGAKEFAPRSLAAAEKSIQDTDAYITANRHNVAEITARSVATVAATEHLVKITRESKSGTKTSSEDTALQIEREQNIAALKQGQLDKKSAELAKVNNKVAISENANQDLASKNAALESDQAFNDRFELARQQFTSSEAEVYKQGDSLVIRLRGLDFPVGKSELKGASFALLAKVQKVINDFENGAVLVEGHTDSTGSKTQNEKLSSDRAQAVKDYLLSINNNQPMSIESVGYGYQKPLATNKTSIGRGQNRRVDVLIKAVRM